MTEAPLKTASEARYLDALLTEMDRWIMPDLASERARFVYAAVRRILGRLVSEVDGRPPFGELGIGAACTTTNHLDLQAIVWSECASLDAAIARQDARIATVGIPPETKNVSQEAVQATLRSLGHERAEVLSMRVVVGGRSKETILVNATGLTDLPDHLVIRRDLQVGSLGTTVVDEFELLRTLHARGAKVPKPFALSRSGEFIGTPYMLLSVMPGGVCGDMITAPASRAKLLSTARTLASIHALSAEETARLLPKHSPPPSREQLAGEVRAFHGLWSAGARDSSATMRAAFAWLLDQVGEVSLGDCFVHGDFGFHNIMFADDEVSAILDWELAHIGHAAEDLGWLKQAVQNVMPWPEFLTAYREAGGRDVSARDVHFYSLFGSMFLLTRMLKARELFELGKTDDVLKADVATYWFPRIIRKVSLEMREILGGNAGSALDEVLD
jgi:aminoglycoside phosphotransferase (APT) family kinase protein